MRNPIIPNIGASSRSLPACALALAASGFFCSAQAQVQTAGDLLVSLDATATTVGPLASITNNGTLGGYLEARGGGATVPTVANVHGNGTKGIQCDGGDYMQLVPTLGAAPTVPPAGIVGANPDYSIEAWVLNPSLQQDETICAWAKRGGPDGSNNGFGYGWDASYGAMGHWGAAADIGWDSSSSSVGVYPAGEPAPGVWHHLVYTFDGTTQRVYVDGTQRNSEAVSLNLAAGTSIVLGAQLDADGLTPVIFGSLTVARLRVHDGVLSASQVTNNFSFEQADFSNGGAPLAAGPTHRYSFNNPAGPATNGAVVLDSIAGGNAVVRGNGATFSGSRVSLPGGASGSAAYVDLPNGLVSTNAVLNGGSGELTLEAWTKVTGAKNWGRIFDIGSSDIGGGVGGEVTGPGGGGEGRDYFMWSATIGTDIFNQRFEFRNEDPAGGGITTIDHPTSVTVTTPRDFHIALSWKESTGEILMYENGSQVRAVTVDDKMSDLHDVNVWLGRSNWTGDENMQGDFDEFRVYSRALPPEQVQASYQAGPESLATAEPVAIATQPVSATAPEAGSARFTVVANGALPITYRWFNNNTLVTSATTATYTFGPVTMADNNAQIFCIVSNNLFRTAYTATSAVVTLTVLADTNPPAISLGRAAAGNQIEVIFSEPVNNADAGTAAKYGVTGPEGPFTVTSAVVESPTRVLLTLASNMTCAYYAISAAGIRDLSAAANSTPAGVIGGAWNFAPSILTHRYAFNNPALANASGATVVDTIGGSNGVIQNAGGIVSFTGDKVSLSGGSSATSPYVDLPNRLLSNNSTNRGGSGQFTFEGWFKATGVQNWARIFDFGSSGGVELTGPGGAGNGSEVLLYAAMIGTDSARRRLEKVGVGGVLNDYGVANFGRGFHFVVTWDEASGAIRAYEDGIQTVSMTTSASMTDVNDLNSWLGRSNWTGDNNTQGEYDEFRVYTRVLTTNDIARNLAGGPDFDYGAPLAYDFVIGNTNMVTNSTRQASVQVNFAKVGWRDVASSGCVAFDSSNPAAVEVTSAGLLIAHDVGSATITASFNGWTASKQVSVITDNTSPTLVRARALGNRFVEVLFSEPLANIGAGDVVNYGLADSAGNDVPIQSVDQLPDLSRVVLNLSGIMPCDYMTLTVNGVSDMVDNFIADNSQVRFMNLTSKGLTHRYTFNDWAGNAPSGTKVRDGMGGGDGFILGSGASSTSDRVVLPGGASASAAYVDLPNGLLSVNGAATGGSGEVSFEGWFKATGNRNWGRIFDFGSSLGAEVIGPGGGGEGTDYFMLSAQNAADTGTRRTELRNDDPVGGGTRTVDHATTNFNQDTHFVVTWKESTGEIKTYANGDLVSSMTVPTQISDIHDVNVWLGRSNWTGDDNAQGEYDEFRVYSRVLTASDIAFNKAAGPDINVGQPVAVRVAGPSSMQVGQTLPPVVLADFTGFTNVDVSLTGCAMFESSAPATIAITPQGQLQALAPGSANITAHFAGLTGMGTVYALVGGLPASNHVAISISSGGSVGVRYSGVPGLTYKLRRAQEAAGPWTVIDTQVAPGSGIIDFVDPTPLVPTSFYRVEGP